MDKRISEYQGDKACYLLNLEFNFGDKQRELVLKEVEGMNSDSNEYACSFCLDVRKKILNQCSLHKLIYSVFTPKPLIAVAFLLPLISPALPIHCYRVVSTRLRLLLSNILITVL